LFPVSCVVADTSGVCALVVWDERIDRERVVGTLYIVILENVL